MADSSRSLRRSFTMVELLVVIALIALLVGLLLAAANTVRNGGKRASTLGTLTSFSGACERFFLDHGYYPGIIPEHILAYHNHQIAHGVAALPITSTENALFHLLGGAELTEGISSNDFAPSADATIVIYSPDGENLTLRVFFDRIGEGPIIDGKAYPPYFSPPAKSLGVLDHGGPGSVEQWPEEFTPGPNERFPDLIDAWGQPILYVRRSWDVGPLGGDAHEYALVRPQFYVDSLWPYVNAPDQIWRQPCGEGGDGSGSLLSSETEQIGDGSGFDRNQAKRGLALLMRSPSSPEDPVSLDMAGAARAGFLVMSAGPDGIYLSADDGPGTKDRPVGATGCPGFDAMSYEEFLAEGSDVLDLFDDIIVYGGGT